ncbi:MAG: TetR/AcrR family transcriptional regulator [Burkholderiaceae bacterium]
MTTARKSRSPRPAPAPIPAVAVAAGQAPVHESRRLILDTAARLFREEGYAATSVRDIAGECGIKAGSIYYHFASKDEIVGEVLRIGVQKTFDQVRQAVGMLPSDADAQLLLGTAVRAHLQAMFHMSDYTIANLRIFGQVPADIRQAHAGLRDEYERYWSSLIARCGQADDLDPARDLQLARFFLIGAMNATLDWFHAGRLSIEAVADELTGLFLGGLRRRRGPRSGGTRPEAAGHTRRTRR